MKRLARPRQQTKAEKKAGVPLDFSATPEELAILEKYNRFDTHLLTDVVDHVGLLPPAEQIVWQLCLTINERGVHFDVPLLDAALAIVTDAKIDVCNRLAELTEGAVTSPQQPVDAYNKWLAKHGHKLSNLQKSTIADALLDPKLPALARQLLELRQGGAGARRLRSYRRCGIGSTKPTIGSGMPIAITAAPAAASRRWVANCIICASPR